MRLHTCAGFAEHSLVAYALRFKISYEISNEPAHESLLLIAEPSNEDSGEPTQRQIFRRAYAAPYSQSMDLGEDSDQNLDIHPSRIRQHGSLN